MALICPYCRTPVDTGEEAKTCEGCGTPHHAECYAENGGCTLFGCKFAPPDDPKVEVTVGEVSQAVAVGGYTTAYSSPPTGFGDVTAPAVVAIAPAAVPPPPPPGASALPTVEPPQPNLVPAASTLFAATERAPKSRLAFILLGIFLGSFGVHNFYAGYTKRGITQLAVTVLTVFYGSFVTWIWALIEVCTVDHDRHNVSFV
ncbi:MAG: NINE protein [Terriglobales bacterium]